MAKEVTCRCVSIRSSAAPCRASDGEIGHVDDFLIDAYTWRIEHLLVDTSNLIGGRHVAVPAANVESIAWAEGLVHVTLSKDAVANSPAPELYR